MNLRPRFLIEYAALRGLSGLVCILPYRAALALAWGAARLAYLCLRSRVREAERRIEQVFGDRFDPRQRRAIAWQSMRNLAFTAVESMRASPRAIRRMGLADRFADALARLEAHRRSGHGAILALAHMGSWELTGAVCNVRGLSVFSIAGRQRNPLFDRFLNGQRARSGMLILTRGKSALRQIVRELKAGRFFAVLPDVRMPTPDLSIPFLGGHANIGSGTATFARHAHVPIFPCILRRDGWTRLSFELGEPIWPDESLDREADAYRMTVAAFRVIEDAIRRDPGQWFWFNRRWVLDPLEPDRSGPAAPAAADPLA